MRKIFEIMNLALTLGLGFRQAEAAENNTGLVRNLSQQEGVNSSEETEKDDRWVTISPYRYIGLCTCGTILAIDKTTNRSLFVLIPEPSLIYGKIVLEDEKTLIKSEQQLKKTIREALSRYIAENPSVTRQSAHYSIEELNFHIIEDTFVNNWRRCADLLICPNGENCLDSLRPWTEELSNYVADSLISSHEFRSSEKIFKAFVQFLAKSSAISSEPPKPVESIDSVFEQALALLRSFGVEEENIGKLEAILRTSCNNKKIILASSEDEQNYKDWIDIAIKHKMGQEFMRLGGGEYIPLEDGSSCILAALPKNSPSEALVLLMHELGHAYDRLKSPSRTHGENWSLLFELATVQRNENILNDYTRSLVFLSRGLCYPVSILLEHIIRGSRDVEDFLALTPSNLLNAREDYTIWVNKIFEILHKDERTKSFIELIEKDTELLEKSKLCFSILLNGLIGNANLFNSNFYIYGHGFMQAFYALTRGTGSVVERIPMLNKAGYPIIDIDFDALYKRKTSQHS